MAERDLLGHRGTADAAPLDRVEQRSRPQVPEVVGPAEPRLGTIGVEMHEAGARRHARPLRFQPGCRPSAPRGQSSEAPALIRSIECRPVRCDGGTRDGDRCRPPRRPGDWNGHSAGRYGRRPGSRTSARQRVRGLNRMAGPSAERPAVWSAPPARKSTVILACCRIECSSTAAGNASRAERGT